MYKIKEYLFTWRNRQALKKNTAVRGTVEYASARHIGLLFSDDAAHSQAINDLVRRLTDDGKQVRALTYFDQMHSTPYDFRFEYFTRTDLSPVGTIDHEKVDRFVDTEFDYLICINQKPFLPFDTILIRSQARCRIGMYLEGKTDYFEMMIMRNPADPLDVWIEQLFHYTQALSVHA